MPYQNSLRMRLDSNCKQHGFLSVTSDSATDVGVREVEDVYVRYLKDGEPVNIFVGLKPCPNAKAPGITEAVNSAMTAVCENWKEKAVALGTDGAAVMVGERMEFLLCLNEISLT